MAVTFFPEGTAALPTDSEQRSLIKLVDLVGSGAGGGGGLSGSGSPEGVVTASPGRTYYDTSSSGFWVKHSGAGNTGWVQLLQ